MAAAAYAVNERQRIIRRGVRAPRDMAIRSYEHQAPFVGCENVRFSDIDHAERQPATVCRRDKRLDGKCDSSDAQKNEFFPEEIEC